MIEDIKKHKHGFCSLAWKLGIVTQAQYAPKFISLKMGVNFLI